MRDENFAIRRAEIGDVAAMSDLTQRAIRQRNAADYTPDAIERSCANFSVEKLLPRLVEREVFIGAIGEKVVATVSFANAKLYSLFVDPDRHGQGFGRQLVAYIERHATALGIPELRLSAAITAQGFYEKLGYETVMFEERPDGSTWLMRKPLVTPSDAARFIRAFLDAIEQDRLVGHEADWYAPDVVQVEFPNTLLPEGATRDLAALRLAACG